MTTITLADGTITRQLLPYGAQGSGRELVKQYRWATWIAEAVSYEQAEFHLGTGGDAACIIVVFRGPQGGWTDARIVRRHDPLPKPKSKRVEVPGKRGSGPAIIGVPRTYYYGWVQERQLRVNLPRPHGVDVEAYKAHLLLHTAHLAPA